MTAREQMGWRAFLSCAIAIALSFVLHGPRIAEDGQPRAIHILTRAGHNAPNLINRGVLRADPGSHRTTLGSAFVLVAAGRIARGEARAEALVERSWPRSLGPVHVESGRSPPVSLS